ncbi:putative metalloprotease CJM1_0395 family protein [Caenispirillum bisanense]|uniref:putative metalloprotease CJM1_0395 family protein n=1 Tax=Caenispirillum bisanense TaxID=414052 RepID=UPI0031D0BACA
MLSPALMQPLPVPPPTPLPPSPVRPAGDRFPESQKLPFPEDRRGGQTPEQQAEAEAPWQPPLAGDTAVAAQTIGQQTDEPAPGDLTPEQQAQVAELKARDAEVRAHEQAHQAVGGRYAGAASYDTVRGPDGHSYAIGGEVPIDVSPGRSPEETIAKMEVVKAAALAPAEPSPQDRRVAALADAQRLQAVADKREQDRAEAAAALTTPEDGGDGAVAAAMPLAYRRPPLPLLLQGMAAYGGTLAMAAPAAPLRFDLVA